MARSGIETGSEALLSLRAVHKSYGPVRALAPLDLDIEAGGILALIGENGAGKSTLMKIIAGAETPTGGTLRFAGSPVRFASPLDARQAGIAIVYQEHALLHDMTVAENLFLGQPVTRAGGLLDRAAMARRAAEVIGRMGLPIDVSASVETLSMVERQVVEIARALVGDVRLLILDEPTAALERRERETLFRIMRDLAAGGVAVIFCSHHLDEIAEVADRTVVLRDGGLVDDMARRDMSHDRIIRAMLGSELSEHFPKADGARQSALALSVAGLVTPRCRGFDLDLGAGEIVGLAGLDGSGREDVLRALFGLLPGARASSFALAGRAARLPCAPGEAVAGGIGFLPADRKAEALFVDQSIAFNTSLAALDRVRVNGLLSPQTEAALMRDDLARVSLKYSDLAQEVQELSGGNQQKVVLARWLGRRPDVLLMEEPTRGIDIRAKAEVYALIGEFVAAGGAVIMMSSDMPELVGIADRVLVFYRGRVSAELSGADVTAEAIAKASYSEVGAREPVH